MTPSRLTLNRHNWSRDQRRRSSSSQLPGPDRHWQRSTSPSRTGTQAAPRPHGQSVPPTTGLGSTGLSTRDSSQPRKRGRESSLPPSRSEYCVRFHVPSPHIERRKRRTHSPEPQPRARSSVSMPRAVRARSARRRPAASPDEIPSELAAGSLSAIFLYPKLHQRQLDQMLSFRESTVFATFLIHDGTTACTRGVYICVGQAFRPNGRPKMSHDSHPAVLITGNHGTKMQQTTPFVNQSPAHWTLVDAHGHPTTEPLRAFELEAVLRYAEHARQQGYTPELTYQSDGWHRLFVEKPKYRPPDGLERLRMEPVFTAAQLDARLPGFVYTDPQELQVAATASALAPERDVPDTRPPEIQGVAADALPTAFGIASAPHVLKPTEIRSSHPAPSAPSTDGALDPLILPSRGCVASSLDAPCATGVPTTTISPCPPHTTDMLAPAPSTSKPATTSWAEKKGVWAVASASPVQPSADTRDDQRMLACPVAVISSR